MSIFLNILLISRCAKLSSVTEGSSAIASIAAIFSLFVRFLSSMCIMSSLPEVDAEDAVV